MEHKKLQCFYRKENNQDRTELGRFTARFKITLLESHFLALSARSRNDNSSKMMDDSETVISEDGRSHKDYWRENLVIEDKNDSWWQRDSHL